MAGNSDLSSPESTGPPERETSRRIWPGRMLWAALLWWWMIPSAYFWSLAERYQALLPDVPRWAWIGPGELWRSAPWLFVVLVLCASSLVILPGTGRKSLRRGIRVAAVAFFVLITAIHLLWGRALLQG